LTSTAEQLRSGEIVILRDFVPLERCELILGELEFAFWAPSAVVRQTRSGALESGLSATRVSETTGEEWFTRELRREIRRIETRLCRRLGLARDHIEPWQATRYSRGGKFEAHFDGGLFWHEPAGEREVTLLAYLTTAQSGGSTRFPDLGLDLRPRAGTVVAWANLTAEGSVDPTKKHEARPLWRGRKITLTTWSRQHPIRESTKRRTKE
jgi:prolyl 4-hydroxylase